MKLNMKKNYSKQNGITLIALIVTIVILLILAGVTLNAVFSDNGIIKMARDAQTKTDQWVQKDLEPMGELEDLINKNAGENKGEEAVKISTMVGKGAVTKNTKAVDAYGNKITIPKGFKVLPHNPTSSTGAVTYTYNEDNTPAVQDGIVIEDTQTGTAGNQFVWVPVGTINNKAGDSRGTTSTITLGRYSDFTMTNGAVASGQPAQVASVENCTQEVTINTYYKELSTSREGNSAEDSTAENATARDLKTFIETSLANGGYYIARFEASKNKTTNKIESQYSKTVLTAITQPNAATLAREMYGEVKENNELVYASDLVNSYAWDTAIIFIQTYSTGEDASNYASKNKSTSLTYTGTNDDKYCNVWDMSGNYREWTTEYSSYSKSNILYPCSNRGGYCELGEIGARNYTSYREYQQTKNGNWLQRHSIRSILYVK